MPVLGRTRKEVLTEFRMSELLEAARRVFAEKGFHEATVDAIADALQAVKDGRLDATVFQDARGQANAALDTTMHILRHEPFAPEVFIPFQLVTRENVAQFLK